MFSMKNKDDDDQDSEKKPTGFEKFLNRTKRSAPKSKTE